MPAEGWSLTADYHHEIKDGTETQGVVVAGRNPTFIAVTPIDYDTDEFDLRLGRATEKGQFELAYHLSMFNNDNSALRFENPFNIPNVSPFFSPLQMSTPPDNMAHAFSFAGGYNLGQTTRAAVNLSYQRMSQDDTFLPYTVNPRVCAPGDPFPCDFVANPRLPLPRNSLDGVINNYFANLTLTGRPLPKLNLTGRYTFDLRDSDTPTNTYFTVRTDSGNQFDIDEEGARVNRDYDREMHKAALDAQYRLMPHATLDGARERLARHAPLFRAGGTMKPLGRRSVEPPGRHLVHYLWSAV